MKIRAIFPFSFPLSFFLDSVASFCFISFIRALKIFVAVEQAAVNRSPMRKRFYVVKNKRSYICI